MAYEPELGQMVFGQPCQELKCPEWLLSYLIRIEEALCRVRGNIDGGLFYYSPFDNTGNAFANEVFAVQAYSWDEDEEQEWNFKWRDLRVSWYKHLRRGTSINRIPSHEEAVEMLTECLESLEREEREYFERENEGE